MAVRSTVRQLEVVHAHVDVDGGPVLYAHAGRGPLMLFLHDSRSWDHYRNQLPAFVDDHLVVAPDLRADEEPAHAADRQAGGGWVTDRKMSAVHRLGQLMDHVGQPSGVVIGHGTGTTVAWSFAFRHPEMVAALVVLDPPETAQLELALYTSPPKISVPTLVLYSRNEQWTRPVRRGLTRHVPNLTLVEVHGHHRGSWLGEHHPELVNRCIREHLRLARGQAGANRADRDEAPSRSLVRFDYASLGAPAVERVDRLGRVTYHVTVPNEVIEL
jgi:pimeloyl-ACP methyl ester carboxylesterase